MPAIVRYLSHPNVQIEPTLQPSNWGLNEEGHARVAELVRKSWPAETVHVVSSAERKAVETATPIATILGLTPEVRPAMHENDRSATGFLPPEKFEKTADQFFANPDQSIEGWETARKAQNRILNETITVLNTCPSGDVLIVGHGAVGTLLICHFGNYPISRVHDQPPNGGGNVFAFQRQDLKLLHGWRLPVEAV